MRFTPLLFVWVVLALYLSTLGSWEAVANSDSNAEAEKLLKQAEELTDIRLDGSRSFRLTARMQISGGKGKVREGTYTLLWKSPTVWRDETLIEDFSQLRIANGEKLFIRRDPPTLTLDVFHLLQLLDFPSLLRFSPEAKAQKLSERNRNGLRERAVEIARQNSSAWKTVFFDSASPTPVRVEYKGSHFGYEFKDYVGFDGHQFPRMLDEFDSGKVPIQVQVQELGEATFDTFSFAPLPGTPWIYWCKHPEHAKAEGDWLNKVSPIPWPLRDGALQHPVAIYGIIGTDGQWHNLTVVKSAGKEVDSYWMDGLRIQHFSPARCGDTPVEQESVTEFRLP